MTLRFLDTKVHFVTKCVDSEQVPQHGEFSTHFQRGKKQTKQGVCPESDAV